MLERGARSIAMIFRAVVFTLVPTALELVAVCWVLGRAFHPRVSGLVVATFAAYSAWTVGLTWVSDGGAGQGEGRGEEGRGGEGRGGRRAWQRAQLATPSPPPAPRRPQRTLPGADPASPPPPPPPPPHPCPAPCRPPPASGERSRTWTT
jgi:hypothetical protein